MRLVSRLIAALVPSTCFLVAIACGSSTVSEPQPPVALPDRVEGDDATKPDSGGADTSTTEDAKEAGPTCDLSKDLVGWWTLDENTGTVAADKSLFKHDGTLVGPPVWTTDKAPTKEANTSALTFDGANTHVEIGNKQELQITGSLSLSAWIKTSVAPVNYRTIVSKWWSGGEDAAYSMYFSAADGVGLSINSAQNVGARAAAGLGVAVTDNAWHLVTGTWDGTMVRIYVDGVQRASEQAPAGFGALANVAHPVRIGTDDRYVAGQGDRYFSGSIDDVRIYRRALIAEEVGMIWSGACKKP